MTIKSIVEKGYYIAIAPDGTEINRRSKRDKCLEDFEQYAIDHNLEGTYKIIQPEVEVLLAVQSRINGTFTPPDPPEGLPDGWTRVTIDGNVNSNFDSANNTVEEIDGVFSIETQSSTFSIGGSATTADDHIDGPGITIDSADDAICIARIVTESTTGDPGSYTSGLMIRESNVPGSRYFAGCKILQGTGTAIPGTRLRERATTDGQGSHINPSPHDTDQGLPQWWMFRLDRETATVRVYFFAGATNPGTNPSTNWQFLGEFNRAWFGSGDLIFMLVNATQSTNNEIEALTTTFDNVSVDFATELDHSAAPSDDVEYWPEQDSVVWTPYIRNRNHSSSSIVSEGRGYGMDSRYCYTGATIGSPTTGTTPSIIHVTNLNDSGAGSLRTALGTSGNRAIVFDTAGRIPVTSTIDVANGNISVLGQCAPGLVMMDYTGSGNAHMLRFQGSNISFHHMALWFSADPPNPGSGTGNNGNCFVAVGTGSPSENLLMDHCFAGGGVDQNFTINMDYEKVTLIDCLFSNPRGKDPGVSDFHKYNGNIAGNSASEDADLITVFGCLFINGKNRNPRCLTEHITLVNNAVYNRIDEGFNATGKTATGVNFFYNILGNWYKPGPAEGGGAFGGLMRFGNGSGTNLVGGGSKFYFDQNAAPTYVNDEWDVVQDRDNQEGTVRENSIVTEAFPEGLVYRDIRDMTAAERIALFKNVGPRPASRHTYFQALLDGFEDGTDVYSHDYSTPSVATTNGAYSETGLNHNASGTDSRYSNFEMDWHTKANALLNT